MIAFLGWLAIWWHPLAFAALLVFLVWFIFYNTRQEYKWENSPEGIEYNQKQAYDAAHAYLKGKACCGSTKN